MRFQIDGPYLASVVDGIAVPLRRLMPHEHRKPPACCIVMVKDSTDRNRPIVKIQTGANINLDTAEYLAQRAETILNNLEP